MAKEAGKLEGAPYWYGTPLGRLDFEWSADEKLEIERYCEKMHKNIVQEEMTPLQRFHATMEGKQKDRLLIESYPYNHYVMRSLDNNADAIKPIDAYTNPKLYVKAWLAHTARFAVDFPLPHITSYAEELWGGTSRLSEHGACARVSDPPIKSMKDLEGLECPDPYDAGLYPGYLWICREFRRIFDEYGLSKVMPLYLSICGDPIGYVSLQMMGVPQFLKALRKDPETVRRALELATQFDVKLGQAVCEVAKPEALYKCDSLGMMPIEGNEWVMDSWAAVGKALAPLTRCTHIGSHPQGLKWLPVMWEKGALGPGSFCGANLIFWEWFDYFKEHNLYASGGVIDKVILRGPDSAIEEMVRRVIDQGKSYPKYAFGMTPSDYWTPPEHVDYAVALAKKLGKF